MTLRRPVLAAILLLLLPFLLFGCGKKGSLKPAWDIKGGKIPKNISDLSGEVRLGTVWLSWSEPVENLDKTRPADIDHYLIYYNILPLEEDYCLDCPLDFGRKIVLDPHRPGPAVFSSGRVEYPLADYDSSKKYVFVVWPMSPEDKSPGDSNVATLNWPLEHKEN